MTETPCCEIGVEFLFISRFCRDSAVIWQWLYLPLPQIKGLTYEKDLQQHSL